MRVSRTQSLRFLMFAVAMVAIFLALEIPAFNISKNIVSEGGDGVSYIPDEARTVWAIFQIPIVVILCFVYGIYRNW